MSRLFCVLACRGVGSALCFALGLWDRCGQVWRLAVAVLVRWPSAGMGALLRAGLFLAGFCVCLGLRQHRWLTRVPQ